MWIIGSVFCRVRTIQAPSFVIGDDGADDEKQDDGLAELN